MSSLRPIFASLRPFWPHMLAGGLCVLASAGATMALVPLAKFAADAFGHLTIGALDRIVLGLIGLYALKGLFTYGGQAIGAYVALEAIARLREQAYAHLLAQGLRFHQRQRSADLASRLVQDLGLLREAIASLLAEVVPAGIVTVYALAYVAWLNWRLALFTFVGVPLVALAIGAFGRRLHALASDIQARVSDLFAAAQEGLSAMLAIKAFGREDLELSRFGRINREHMHVTWRGAQLQALQGPTIALLQTIALGAVLWVGGWEITRGRLSGSDLLAFAAAIGVAVDPTLVLSNAWGKLQLSLAGARRVAALLEAAEPLLEDPAALPLGIVEGALRFEAVHFSYDGDRPALAGLDLDVAPGEILAIVGPSGGGKSTLAHLALRLFDPDAGVVRLDGRDLRSVRLADMRRAVALVPQEPVLFAGTVAENVAFGQPGASREAIVAACEAAAAHDFILALPQGYDTPLGERGGGLSGGQRQRLGIARALLADPRVLVLDEATSALDNQAEERVREAITRLMAGRTTLIVAHRLSAIERADRIVVIVDGRIAEAGDRETLLARDGRFRALVEAGEFRERSIERS